MKHRRQVAGFGLVVATFVPVVMQFVLPRVDNPTLGFSLLTVFLALMGTGWILVWRNAEHPGLSASGLVTLGLSGSAEERQ